MSSSLPLDGYTRTDPGRVRENNEDAAGGFAPADPAVLEERGALFVVADGMGGHAAGEVASNYAVNKILHAYYSLPWEGGEQTLAAAVQEANAEINAEGEQTPERRGMGSTVVAAAILDGRAVVANVGDSRAYLLHEGRLEPITRDHSWVAEHLADGMLTPEQAADHPNRNILTRNLGLRAVVEPDVRTWEFADGDRLLLCTDGLWGAVPEEQIAALLQQRTTAERATAALIAAANAAGGHDNIGVAVIGRGTAGGGNTRLFSNVPEPSFAAPITRQVALQRTGLLKLAPYALAASAGVIVAAVIFAVAQAGGNGPFTSKRSSGTPSATASTATVSWLANLHDVISALVSRTPNVSPTPPTKNVTQISVNFPTTTPTQSAATAGLVLYTPRHGDVLENIFKSCYTTAFQDEAAFTSQVQLDNSGLDPNTISEGIPIWLPGNFTGATCPVSGPRVGSTPTPRAPEIAPSATPTATVTSASGSTPHTQLSPTTYHQGRVSAISGGRVPLHVAAGDQATGEGLDSGALVCLDPQSVTLGNDVWWHVTGNDDNQIRSGWVSTRETIVAPSSEVCA